MAEKRKQSVLDYFIKKAKKDDSSIRNNVDDTFTVVNTCSDSVSSISDHVLTSKYPEQGTSVIVNNSHDIALLKEQKFNSVDTLDIIKKLWKPEPNFNFPVSCAANHNRSFQYKWFEKFAWLVYSQIENCAYCKYCVIFAPAHVGKSKSEVPGQLVTQGFNNWKKAIEKFRNHQKTQYHIAALMTYERLQNIQDRKCISIDQQIDLGRASQAAVNRKRLEPIIKTVILCGRQNIPLRGHRDYGEFSYEQEPVVNEGNFRALLRMRIDAGDENLIEHFKHTAKNATYISWNIQNQIINACNEIILNHLVKKVNSAKCFSVLADETCDISTTEHISLCVRYIDEENDKKVCEQFLQFVPVTSTTGKNLSDKILESLHNCGIDLSYLRGQGYDGAASMSGKFNGVQSHISAAYPKAVYVHCASHCLNLAIGNAVSVTEIRNCIGIIERVYNFFNTPKRQGVLVDNVNKHTPDTNKRQKLRQVCPTRWVERHEAIMTMVELYDAVIHSLETIISWEDRDSSSNAQILSNSLCEFGFIISLLSLQNIFAYTLPLSKIMQKSDNDLLSALHFVDDVMTQLNTVRETPDSLFKNIYDEACIKANNFNIDIKKPRTTSRQTLRSNLPADSVEEYFRRTVFIPFIDQILTQLHDRFIGHRNILKRFCSILPNGKGAPTANAMEDFHQLCEFYAPDLHSTNSTILNAEFKLWYKKFENNCAPCKNAIDAVSKCDKDIYPSIYNLLKIFATLPVTTCVSERSFSTLHLLKTYLRSTMTHSRLNGLALLYIYRNITVNTSEVIDELSKKKRKLDFII